MKLGKKAKKEKEFSTEYTVTNAFKKGDFFTRLSALILGLGNIVRKEYIKGFLFLCSEILFIYSAITFIVPSLAMLPSLGHTAMQEVFNEEKQLYEYIQGDNSMLILLYGVIAIFIMLAFIVIWRAALKSAYKAQYKASHNIPIPTFREEMKEYLDVNLHKTLLFLPIMSILAFTIMPLVYMILMAFTNYDRDHQPPGNLFTWVGLDNFRELFDFGGALGNTFWHVLLWTIVWAVLATFLTYIFGMLLALLVNRKDTRFKRVYRMFFVVTIAVPQFVTLLFMSSLLDAEGAVNVILRNMGWIKTSLPFWTNVTWARVTIIVINMWIGIPYTLLTMTGILKNIPEELYEAARVDGASPFVIYRKITLPYVLFITAPSLITQFVGNINNFNVIYLLTAGNPSSMDYYKLTAGKTDLLVTWLYKLTIDNKDYNLGSTIGIVVFIMCAVSSILAYQRTGAFKNEEGFQ